VCVHCAHSKEVAPHRDRTRDKNQLATMPTTTKDDRINFRVPAKQKRRVKKAAAALGVTMTDFIKQTAVKEADEVLSTRQKTVLSDKDRNAFLDALSEDTPNDALQDAVDTHNEMVGD